MVSTPDNLVVIILHNINYKIFNVREERTATGHNYGRPARCLIPRFEQAQGRLPLTSRLEVLGFLGT